MTPDTLQPFEQSFMISPRTGQNNDKPSYLFTPPSDAENFLVETFHQYPHGDFRPTFYNPFEIKHRRRTSRAQLKILEETFTKYTKPSATVRRILAQKLGMSARGVQIWFQNRRAKEKQLKSHQKEESPSEQEDQHQDHPLSNNEDTTNTAFDSDSSFAAVSESSMLFSNFSTPHQQPIHTDLSMALDDKTHDQKHTISDNVRALATNAAMVAMSNTASTNWPSIDLQYPNLHETNAVSTKSRDPPHNQQQQDRHHSMYLSPSWSPLVYPETNVQHFDQDMNFSYVQQQLTPPLSAHSTVPGSPISLDGLYTDPIIYPNEFYYNFITSGYYAS